MPSRESHQLALILIGKAEGDESILDKLLDDTDVPDEALGFHLQQAVEKRLKAVLTAHEIEYDRTHSVSYLTALLEHSGIDLPRRREQIEELTPWAVAAHTRSSTRATRWRYSRLTYATRDERRVDATLTFVTLGHMTSALKDHPARSFGSPGAPPRRAPARRPRLAG